MADDPVDVGAVKATDAEESPAVATPMTGALGGVAVTVGGTVPPGPVSVPPQADSVAVMAKRNTTIVRSPFMRVPFYRLKGHRSVHVFLEYVWKSRSRAQDMLCL